MKKKVLIMGAAGRDFHNFNTAFRGNKNFEVVCFTATQIPNIEDRKYPAQLAGKGYPKGIPIYSEEELTDIMKKAGKKLVVVRHPMPYGNLVRQTCQRFASFKDLDRYDCTFEEREEFEPHLERRTVVYAGVDYEKILRQAEKEADVILWDGGNN